MKSKIFYLSFIILLSGCEKENYHYANSDQQILFQVEYINYAWGYQHSGIVIDSSGSVRYFKSPKNWNYSDTASYISESDMNENILQLDTVLFKIEKNILLKYFSMLKGASEGQLSKPENRMFDAGETTYSGFLFDSNSRKYKPVIVKIVGDWSRDNSSPEAEEIYDWLMKTYYYVLQNLNNYN